MRLYIILMISLWATDPWFVWYVLMIFMTSPVLRAMGFPGYVETLQHLGSHFLSRPVAWKSMRLKGYGLWNIRVYYTFDNSITLHRLWFVSNTFHSLVLFCWLVSEGFWRILKGLLVGIQCVKPQRSTRDGNLKQLMAMKSGDGTNLQSLLLSSLEFEERLLCVCFFSIVSCRIESSHWKPWRPTANFTSIVRLFLAG